MRGIIKVGMGILILALIIGAVSLSNIVYAGADASIDSSLSDKDGNAVPGTLIVEKSDDGTVIIEDRTDKALSISEGTYDIRMVPDDVSLISEISIDDTVINAGTTNIMKIDNVEDNQGWEELYAINPEGLEFVSATVKIADAKGNWLYKCPTWDFASQTCPDDAWMVVRKDLEIGQPYDITMAPGDPAWAESIQPNATIGKDSYIVSGSPNTNYGTDTTMYVVADTRRSVIQFDLSGLPAGITNVTSANLTLFLTNFGSGTPYVAVYRITRDWTETGVTWNNATASQAWTTAGGDFSATEWANISLSGTGYYTFPITQLVNATVNGTYANQGWMLRSTITGTGTNQFASSDNTNSTRWPELDIAYDFDNTICNYNCSSATCVNNIATPGATICVNSTIEVITLDTQNQTVKCVSGGKINGQNTSSSAVVTITANGTTLQDCEVYNHSASANFAIVHINNADDTKIYNNTIHDGGQFAVLSGSSNDVIIENNTMYNINIFDCIKAQGSFDNIIRNNTIYNCAVGGVYYSSNSNRMTVDKNTIYNSSRGIVLDNSDNSTVTNNVIYNNSHSTFSGIYVNGTIGMPNTYFANNTIYNVPTGIYDLHSTTNVTYINNWIYNTSNYGFYASYNNAINIINMTFGYSNKTSINATAYKVYIAEKSFSSLPALPSGSQYLDSYLNMSNNSANGWINITMPYNITKVSVESNVYLYEYNTSWYKLTSTRNTTIHTVNYNLTAFSTFAPLEEVVGCQNVTTSLTLNQDIVGNMSNGYCFDIQADNIVLDCAGYKVNASTLGGTYGILAVGRNNVTVKNCEVLNYSQVGILFSGGTNYSTAYNNTVHHDRTGMYIFNNANYNNFSFNRVYNNTDYGIIVRQQAYNNTVDSNNVSNETTYDGIILWDRASYNNVTGNRVDGSNIAIYAQINSTNNYIAHNTILDYTQRGMSFLDNASYNTIYNNTFVGPFTQCCILSQRNITNNIYDSNNLSTCGTYGFWEQLSSGFLNNLTYKNNYIYNSTNGIWMDGGNNRIIDNNTILKSNYGISATNTTNVNATYNNITDIVWSGIELQGTNNTYLYDNNVSNGYNPTNRSTGFNIDHSNYTYIYDNRFDNLTSGYESFYAEWGGGVRSVIAGHDMEVHDNAVTNSGFGIGISAMSNINVYNNDVSARQFGIWSILSFATNVNIYNNSIHDVRDAIGSGYASLVTYSQNNFYNNTVYNNTYGIRVGYTSSFPSINSNLTNSYNNTVYGNDYGIFVNSNSHDNNFTDDNVYNNSIWDVKVVSGYNNRFRNVTIGYDDNKVKSSFDGTNYTIKQVLSSERPSDPYTHRNISKYLNLTNTTDNGWIFLNVSYLDSDVVGLNENSMKFWRNSSGTWTSIGDGVNTANNYVYANISSSEFGSIFAPLDDDPYAITSCRSINSSGYYYMTNNINGNITGGNCLTINGTNIILDCAGYNMIGTLPRSPPYTIGIMGYNTTNVTIKNCFISNYHQAIRFESSPNFHRNTTFYNNTFYNSTIGLGIYTANYTNITNNTFINISQTAIGSGTTAYFYTIEQNEIYGLAGGMQLDYTYDSLITRNHEYNYSAGGAIVLAGARNNITYNIIHDHTDSNTMIYLQQTTSVDNIVAHNTLYNSPYYGIRVESGLRNTIYNNTVTNTSRGIILGSGGYTNVIENNIINCSQYGIYINTGSNNTLSNNNVSGSTLWDVYVDGATNNTFINTTIGKDDYKVLASFDGAGYNLKSILPASLPSAPSGSQYLDSYLNISNNSATGWINITMPYNETKTVSENSVYLYKYNTSWYKLPSTRDVTTNTVNYNITSFSIFAPLESPAITNCQNITTSGTHLVSNNINGYLSSNNCLDIQTDNVLLDCQNYNLTGNTSVLSSGIYVFNHTNVTVRNCNVMNYSYGIYSGSSNLSLFTGNSLFNNDYYGLYTSGGYNNNITSNYAYDNNRIGIYYNGSFNILIDNNTVYNNSVSCSPNPQPSCCGIGGGSNATITNNRIYSNNNGDGITTQGAYITINNNTIYNNYDGIYSFTSANNSINNNDIYNIIGNGIEIYSGSYNTNMTNNRFSNCSNAGIKSSGAASRNYNFKLINNTLNNSYYGTYIYYTNASLIENNTFINDSYSIYGVYFDDNIIQRNNITNQSTEGIHIAIATNNLITLNNITSSISNHGIYINGTATYNNVTFNNIFDSSNYGVYIDSDYNNVKNNYIDNTFQGIHTESSGHLNIENNVINNSYLEGIYVGSSLLSHYINIYNNSIPFYGNDGIAFRGFDSTIINNSLYNSTTGSSYAMHIYAGAYNVTVDGNKIHDSTYSQDKGIVFTDVSNSTIKNTEAWNMWENPILMEGNSNNVNATDNYIHDSPTSACIWVGGVANINTYYVARNNCTNVGEGILIENAKFNGLVEDNIVNGTTQIGAYVGCFLIYNNVSNLLVRNNILTNCRMEGIRFDGVNNISNVTIDSNNITNTGQSGISTWSSGSNYRNITIINNRLINVSAIDDSNGIRVRGNYGGIIYNNYIDRVQPSNSSYSGFGINIADADGWNVSNNYVNDVKSHSIRIESGSTNNTIFNNTITNGYAGVITQIYDNINNTILNNTIVNMSQWGVYLATRDDYCNVKYNNITNAPSFISLGYGMEGIHMNGANHTNVQYNTITNIRNVGIESGSSSYNTIDSNDIRGIATCGRAGIWTEVADYVNITNNVIRDSFLTDNANTLRGIDMQWKSHNIIVSNNTLRNLTNNGTPTSNVYGILVETYNPGDYAENITIANNIISDMKTPNSGNVTYQGFGIGIWALNYGNNIDIYGNNVSGDTAVGFDIINTGGLKAMNNTRVHDNDFCNWAVPIVLNGAGYNVSFYNNKLHCSRDFLFGGGIGDTDTYAHVDIYDNEIYDNWNYGIRLGYTSLLMSPTNNSHIYNNTLHDNGIGVFINSGSYDNIFENNWIYNSTSWDVHVTHGSNNIFKNTTIGPNASEWTIDSFDAMNVSFRYVPISQRPPDPLGYTSLLRYINATNNSASNYIVLNISYEDSDIIGIDESTIKMWRYNSTGVWLEYSDSIVDTANNYVYGNISNNFSIIGLFGLPPPTPINGGWGTYAPNNTNYEPMEDTLVQQIVPPELGVGYVKDGFLVLPFATFGGQPLAIPLTAMASIMFLLLMIVLIWYNTNKKKSYSYKSSSYKQYRSGYR